MHTIQNLTNGPFDLMTVNGSAILPANGEISDEFSPEYIALLDASGAVSVVRGKSSPSSADQEIARLRVEYSDLTGKKFYHGWDAAELQKRIDAALEA